MPDQISPKLGAYLDGELDQRSQSEVETHLETCPACQAELEELRQLSQLLRAAPQPDFTPALDFKAQFMLQLPRRAQEQTPRSNGRMLTWMAPALVLAGWIFLQVTLGLTTLVSLANQSGLLGGAAAWANSGPQQMLWFTSAQVTIGAMFSPQGQTGLQVLNDAGLFTQNMLIALLWQIGAAVLYWGALTLVWRDKVKALWTSPTAG
jgi:anti-sigma factor RsiW